MKLYTVRVMGLAPMLQCRFSEDTYQDLDNYETPREQTEKLVYRTNGPGSPIWFPGRALARLIRVAGSLHKPQSYGKRLKSIIPTALFVLEDQLPIYNAEFTARLTDFKVDSRPIVMPGGC